MRKSKTPDSKVENAGSVFQITGNHRAIKLVVSGEKDELCDLLACALEQSQRVREILYQAMALLALRQSMRADRHKKRKKKGGIKNV